MDESFGSSGNVPIPSLVPVWEKRFPEPRTRGSVRSHSVDSTAPFSKPVTRFAIADRLWLKRTWSGTACLECVAMPPTAAETLRAWVLSALVVHGAVAGNPDAKRLYDDLLSNYNKLVRPVVNTSDVLRVCIKLKLSQLIDVVR